jgi:putative transposase
VQPGFVYHVLNRGNGRGTIFHKDGDYHAFERVLCEAFEEVPMRLLAYCVMPNHWHLVLWPQKADDLSRFVGWLTLTHTQRWHAHYHTTGTGHVYQNRFKSFPVQEDEHLLTVLRYVERNALRAGLVQCAEEWRWSSLWRRTYGSAEERAILSAGPLPLPAGWPEWVNEAQSLAELSALRGCVERGKPFGDEAWTEATADRLGLRQTLRPRGRPRKAKSAPAGERQM